MVQELAAAESRRRQAAQYLNGTLTIERLGGSVLTGIELEGVALHHEGQTAVAMDKLTVRYSPITMISQGLILESADPGRARRSCCSATMPDGISTAS